MGQIQEREAQHQYISGDDQSQPGVTLEPPVGHPLANGAGAEEPKPAEPGAAKVGQAASGRHPEAGPDGDRDHGEPHRFER
jgi:hypothetical protein